MGGISSPWIRGPLVRTARLCSGETMEALLSERARGSTSSTIRDLLRLSSQPHILSMAGGLPAPELFPVDELGAIAACLFGTDAAARAALQYGPTEGCDELRAIVAPDADPANVLITTGSQQALDLLARTLVDRDDIVVVESPSYLGALQAMRAEQPNLVPIENDVEGLDTTQLERHLVGGLRPKLCYVVPNFSNPSGATLSCERRRHLAALADTYGFVVIEDDPYGLLRYEGAAIEPIRAHGANVVTLGSTSKTLAPGLRVGWAVLPKWLMAPMVRAKQAADLHTSSLSQAIAAQALQAPWFPGHLAGLRAAYARRAHALCDVLDANDDVFAVTRRPAGGMFVWARLRGLIDASALLPMALASGVAYVPGAAFAELDCFRDRLRLSFATLTVSELREAVTRLATVVRS